MDGPAEQEAATPPSPRRGIGVGLGIGAATAVGVAALVYAVAAIPLYLLAKVSPDGLDRPAFKSAFVAAIVVGGVLGLLVGAAAGVWAYRGGRLPADRTPFLDR